MMKGKQFFGILFSWRGILLAVTLWMWHPPVLHAQVAFSLGGPYTKIIVLNNTSDNTPILPNIGGRIPREALGQGGQWGRAYGFASGGEIPILVQICNDATEETRTNHPPDWAANVKKLGPLALTPAYLGTNPSEPELKERVKEIKNLIHHELGRKEMEAELNQWFTLVKSVGIEARGIACSNPMTIAAVTFTWNYYDYYYYAGDRVTMVVISGNRESGYHVEAPRWVR